MSEKDLFYKGLKDLALRCLEEGRPLAYLLFVKQLCRNEAEEKHARRAFRAALREHLRKAAFYFSDSHEK